MVFSNEKLGAILGNILQNDSLAFSVIGKYIIISKAFQPPVISTDSIPEEADYISGLIVDDETFDPLPFAAIALKNKGRGTVTITTGNSD